ncbi:MAG: MFS transporter [Actinobacteria bacterium]|nr:MFS transporter [Actinomycetota bacterium]
MSDGLVAGRPEVGDPRMTTSARGRVWLLTVACMSVSLVVISMVALNTALGDVAVETSATQAQLTWVVDGYTLVLACLLLPAGAIGDRYGRRGALLIGLAIFALASAGPLILDSPQQIIAARAVTGAGAAFIMPATLSLLTAAFPRAERAKAIGIWAGVAGSGAVVGFLGSGILLHFWSWRSIFWAFVAAGVVMFALTCTVSSSRDPDAAPLDWFGAVLIGAAVAVFVFGVLEAPIRGWTHPAVYGCMAAGVALAAAFAAAELRRTHPLLDVRLFGRPDFATGALGITLLFFANFGFFFVVIQYIQLVLGYSPIRTAIALCPLVIPVLALATTTHLYLPGLGLRVVMAGGLAVLSAGLVCMRTLRPDSGYLDLAWPLLVMSIGIGLCTTPATAAIMGAVPDEKQGVASAVNDTTREVGAAVGIALAGSLLATRYTDVLAPYLSGVPDPVRAPALGSLAEALSVSRRLGPQGERFADLAKSAFVEAMDLALTVMAAVIAVAAILVVVWSPGRDGRQWRFLRGYHPGGRHRA